MSSKPARGPEDFSSELARLVAADEDAERAISLAERYGRSAPESGSAATVCLSAGRVLMAKDQPDNAAVYFQCARASRRSRVPRAPHTIC